MRCPLNTFMPSLFIIYLMASCAFTELPASSKGGAKAEIPITPGITPITPPPTPVLAGIPEAVSYTHLDVYKRQK